MPLRYQQLYFNNFDGGITDNYINADINQYKTADNFIIEDGGLRLRYGNRVIFNASSTERIMGLFNMNEEVFFAKGDSFYKLENAVYEEQKTFAELQAPIDVSGSIRDAKAATWVLREFLSGEIVYVHFDTEHSTVQIKPEDAVDLQNITYTVYGFERYNNELIINPPLASFFNVADETSYPSAAEWQDQLHVVNSGVTEPTREYNYPMRVWKESESPEVYKSVRLGLPQFEIDDLPGEIVFPQNQDLSPTPNHQYLYYFHYEYEYFVGDIRFKNVSTVYSEIAATAAPIGTVNPPFDNTVQIAGFPDLNEARIDNDSVRIGIYRTTDGGTTARKIGEVPNGYGGVFVDNVKDEDIATGGVDELGQPLDDAGIVLYTEGGLSEHYPAPKCRYLMIVNDTAYYMNVIEETSAGEEFRPYRFVQSIPNAPSAVDPSNFDDLDDVIVGGSHIDGVPLIFTKSFIYRIEGAVSADGSGSIRKRVISDTVGCLSHNSIVRTNDGVFFAGNNGIYVTDGYRTKLLTEELDDTYAELVSTQLKSDRITATYDAKNELIYWAFSEKGDENDVCWVYNIKKGGFTRTRGIQMDFSSLMFFQKYVMRGDSLGYIYEFNEDDSSDLRRDPFNPFATDWEKERIDYEFETVAIDGGNPHARKWGHECTFSITSSIPSAIAVYSNNDDGEKTIEMKEIKLNGSIVWQSPNFVWRDEDFQWRLSGTQTRQRRFPRGSARFRRKQILIKPSITNLYKSDTYDLADVYVNPDDDQKLIVEIQGNAKWPEDITKDIIRFDADKYINATGVVDERIVERLDDKRIVIDRGQVAERIGGDYYRWTIVGYKRDQALEIRAMSVKFAPLDNVSGEYKSSEAGENS